VETAVAVADTVGVATTGGAVLSAACVSGVAVWVAWTTSVPVLLVLVVLPPPSVTASVVPAQRAMGSATTGAPRKTSMGRLFGRPWPGLPVRADHDGLGPEDIIGAGAGGEDSAGRREGRVGSSGCVGCMRRSFR